MYDTRKCFNTLKGDQSLIFLLFRESPNCAASTSSNQNQSVHYSKHSSLHTDLSLTPSPQQHPNINNQPDPEDVPESEEDDLPPSTGFLSKTVEESLSTPQNIQEAESSSQLSTTEDDSDASSPHFNTPEPAEDEVSTISSTCITIHHSTPTTVQDTDLTPHTDTSFHDDILNLSANINTSDLHTSPYIAPCSKPCTINNNLGPGSRTPCSSVHDSPSYCSPSPVYSIPSPGSAFSIVINRRRESES